MNLNLIEIKKEMRKREFILDGLKKKSNYRSLN